MDNKTPRMGDYKDTMANKNFYRFCDGTSSKIYEKIHRVRLCRSCHGCADHLDFYTYKLNMAFRMKKDSIYFCLICLLLVLCSCSCLSRITRYEPQFDERLKAQAYIPPEFYILPPVESELYIVGVIVPLIPVWHNGDPKNLVINIGKKEPCPVIYGPAGHVDGLRKSVDEPWFCSYSLDVREKENYYFMWNGENWFFHFYRDARWSYTPVMI